MYTPLPMTRMVVGLPGDKAMPSRNVAMVKGEGLEVELEVKVVGREEVGVAEVKEKVQKELLPWFQLRNVFTGSWRLNVDVGGGEA